MTICGHTQEDTPDRCHCGDMPCQLPAGHPYGHWYAPRIDQDFADLLNER